MTKFTKQQFINPTRICILFFATLGLAYSGYHQYIRRLGGSHIANGHVEDLVELVSNRPYLATYLLREAFEHEEKEAFEHLLIAGADATKSRWGAMPLIHRAVERDDSFWLAQILLNHGDPNQNNTVNSIYPLSHAIEQRKPDNAKLLIENGADVNSVSAHGQSVLAFAWSYGEFETAYNLLKHGANINTPGLVSKSLIFNMQFHLQGTSYTRAPLNDEDARALSHVQKVFDWFDEQGIDWRNATYDETTGNVVKVWNIPRLRPQVP